MIIALCFIPFIFYLVWEAMNIYHHFTWTDEQKREDDKKKTWDEIFNG